MRIEPRGIWSLVGVELGAIYPTVVDCPLCKRNSKLEVRTTDHIYCRNCHFVGDLISLVAEFRDEPIKDTIADLRNRGLVDDAPETQLKGFDYLTRYDRQRRLKAMWKRRVEQLRENSYGAIQAIKYVTGTRYSEPVFQALLPHVCLLRRKDFVENDIEFSKEVRKAARPTLTWWGQYTALAIPAWQGAYIVGFWLITTKGSNYLPVVDWAHNANGFGLVPSVTDDAVFVVNDPLAALRCSVWSIIETGSLTGFVVPYGVRDNAETYQCGRTIFWAPDGDSHWYLRALRTPSAQILDHREVPVSDISKEYPCGGSFSQFKRRGIDSLPSHQAVAYHLLGISAEQAKVVFSGSGVDPSDKAKILAYTQGDDAQRLSDLFEDTLQSQAVTWNGSIITDTPDGWMCNGKIVSSVKLVIEQVRPKGKTGDATVIGHLVYKNRSYKFREQFSTIRRNPGAWVQQHIVMNAGCIPYISKSWGGKLVEIAQQFHIPTPVMEDHQYGWSDGTLRMPHFAVDDTNVYATQSMVEGPRLILPAALAKSEWAAYFGKAFCRLALAFLGNLIRTRNNHPGIGIMLTNRPHIVGRLASTFMCDVILNPTPELVAANSDAPLPLFTEWKEYKLSNLFEKPGYKNVVFSTDSHTAALSRINPDWLHLRVGSHIDYPSLRSIFILLPALLRAKSVAIDSDTFYRSIADVISVEVSEHCETHRLMDAAVELDHHSSCCSSTAASRIMELIFYGVERGDIKPTVLEDRVLIDKDEFVIATASPVVPMPSSAKIREALVEARFLIDVKHPGERDFWCISRSTWDMNMSLYTMENALS